MAADPIGAMRAVLRILEYLVGLTIGGAFVLAVLRPDFAQAYYTWLRDAHAGQVMAAAAGGFLLLTPVLLALSWWRSMRKRREISYSTDTGRIAVSLIAIEEALTRALEGEPEVKKANVRVWEDRVKRAVLIDAAMTLWEVPDVTERNRFCQRLLRRRFAELMPEREQVQVNLKVHRLNVRPPPAPRSADSAIRAPAPPAPAAPRAEAKRQAPATIEVSDDELYVGPSYPVLKDDDEGGGTAAYSRPASSAGIPIPPKR